MSKNKKKVKKLTEEQYLAYVTALENDPSLYCADGRQVVPDEYVENEREGKEGD